MPKSWQGKNAWLVFGAVDFEATVWANGWQVGRHVGGYTPFAVDLSGVARVLKAQWPAFKVFAVEPSASPVISGGNPSPHPIQGIGAGFIPANLKTELLDGVIQVEAEPAREYARRSAREEGLLVGISSGATLAAIAQKLPDLAPGSRILGFNYDTGERYLSVEDFLPAA